LSAPTPRGVVPRGTEQGPARIRRRHEGVVPRGTEQGSGERRGFADDTRASSHVGRSRGAASGEDSPTPRGVVPRGTEQGSGDGASSRLRGVTVVVVRSGAEVSPINS